MVNIPKYTMGEQFVDFAPVTNALAAYREQRNTDRTFDYNVQKNKLAAANALAQRQMELQKFEWEKNKFGQELSMNAPLRDAQTQYYLARANAANAPAPVAAQPPPQPQYGMREDGTVYEINGGGGAAGLAGGDNLGLGANTQYGGAGVRASSVPGVVVNDRGGTDREATQAYRGQAAIDKNTAGDRDRAMRFMETQQKWTTLHGARPRAGYMYDEQGREVAKGPMTNAADQSERKERAIGNMLRQIDVAETELLKTGAIGRTAAETFQEAGPVGRFANNMLGLEKTAAALNQYKEGVLQTVYALSGKQTTNKEMEAFLSLYMPRGGESPEMIRNKGKQLRQMLRTLQSNVKKGMVYEDAERLAISSAGATEAPANPARSRLFNKYGLE